MSSHDKPTLSPQHFNAGNIWWNVLYSKIDILSHNEFPMLRESEFTVDRIFIGVIIKTVIILPYYIWNNNMTFCV